MIGMFTKSLWAVLCCSLAHSFSFSHFHFIPHTMLLILQCTILPSTFASPWFLYSYLSACWKMNKNWPTITNTTITDVVWNNIPNPVLLHPPYTILSQYQRLFTYQQTNTYSSTYIKYKIRNAINGFFDINTCMVYNMNNSEFANPFLFHNNFFWSS